LKLGAELKGNCDTYRTKLEAAERERDNWKRRYTENAGSYVAMQCELDAAKAKLAAAMKVVEAVRHALSIRDSKRLLPVQAALRAFDATASAPESLGAPKRGSSRE
jgi:hypothetical protein